MVYEDENEVELGNGGEELRNVDGDYEYERFVDDVICSSDFQNCEHKSADGDCLLVKDRKRCWHIFSCPVGKSRR
jgi:hypothetical protein